MTKEELKNKCKERAKIFQQAMESCKSSNPIDCIEWFADRIEELEKENARLTTNEKSLLAERKIIVKENAELKAKNKWYSEQICNKECAEVWGNLTKAKEIIKILLQYDRGQIFPNKIIYDKYMRIRSEAEQFLKEETK